ncbi:MAG: hypothetical protein QOI78_4900 [Actinomycetota bacterium]|jgi:hypothetical protein|nr:hypothetical protein [Actinomycetota bacterium]
MPVRARVFELVHDGHGEASAETREVPSGRVSSVVVPRRYAPGRPGPGRTGVVTIEITGAPARVGYVVWAEANPTPAASAFAGLLGVDAGRQEPGGRITSRGDRCR